MDSVVDKKLLPLDFKCTLSTTLAKRKVQARLPKEEVSMGTEATRSPKELPIACKLTNEEQQKRREELSRELFSGREGTRELDDGYEFVFAGGADWAEKLVSFVVSERECCPFFTFELIFEPEGGPISLRMRGPEGAKDLMREEFVGG